ncbi:MAG: hypothetical protein JKY36_01750 [Erythrobacter sp.]|nr:hypothetical protein [Erythrobacter sp.]
MSADAPTAKTAARALLLANPKADIVIIPLNLGWFGGPSGEHKLLCKGRAKLENWLNSAIPNLTETSVTVHQSERLVNFPNIWILPFDW